MRNAQLQDKLQEILDELQHLPDDLVVAHHTDLGLVELTNVCFELLNAVGQKAARTEKVDCITFGIN